MWMRACVLCVYYPYINDNSSQRLFVTACSPLTIISPHSPSFALLQREILDLLYSVFQLKVPEWTESHHIAVASIGTLLLVTAPLIRRLLCLDLMVGWYSLLLFVAEAAK